ncbi:MAG: hypothetical protein V4724_36450 [Pseudomonadota bacterium]
MNIPLKKLNAVPGAIKALRVGVGFLAAGCALMLGVSSAHAYGSGEGPGDQNAPRKEESRNPPRQERDRQDRERDARSFEVRAEEHRRALQENSSNNAEMSRRVGRMTADERRDLRRQINEAGQEVYALPPRR